MKKFMIAIFTGLMIEAATTGASDTRPTQSGKTYALIVSGINKDPKEQQAKDNAIINLRNFLLNKGGVQSDQLSVLVSYDSPIKGSKISTTENLKKKMNSFANMICPSDRFIFYYVGQANVVTKMLRLNLPGKDMTHEQLAIWIKGIKASSILIVLDCPGAGLAVKSLTGKNRIIIGASTDEERYSTQFSQYFIPALTDLQSDTDSDGNISVLEAFTVAARQLDESYRQQNLLQTETPILEDNADGVASLQPWRYREDHTDGLAASKYFLSQNNSEATR
ncbi:MAG: hypothetical protein JXM79_06225 [Sedimentisphaerales bacterium]|nr:hypothetical protein [Sedimentisphaerales bacterium]